MKKKMAFIDLSNFSDWPMGGMLEYELVLLKHLVKEYDVDIWGVSVDGKANEFLTIDGEKYIIHIYGNVKTTRKLIPNYWRGLELYFKRKEFYEDYDVVYAHTGSCIVAAKRMIDRKKTKLVYHQHGLNHRADYSLMSLIQRPGLRIAQKAADLVFVVSDEASVDEYSQKMKSKSRAKFVSVGSPLNLEMFNEELTKNKIASHDGIGTKKFIYTGRLTAFKNVKTLIEAMKIYVTKNDPHAHLDIVGSGSELENLKKMIIDYKLENNIKLLGAVSHDQIYEFLGNSDIFLTASGGEGVSVSVLEAYASGLPIVCFNVPGLEGQVIDGKTGIIAKERSVKGFYDAMVCANSHRTELAYNCLEEAKKYDSKFIANKIINEINNISTN